MVKPDQIQTIAQMAARRLNVKLATGVDELISRYTIEGRRAVQLVADAYGHAYLRKSQNPGKGRMTLTREDIENVVRTNRLTLSSAIQGSSELEVGSIYGLGVSGYVGSCLEFEAAAFQARDKGKGVLRFNEAAGHMARDSVFNAASAIRHTIGKDLYDYDVHVNVVGGGKVDGPSAGLAVVLALASTLENLPIPQDIAVTGEVTIQSKVKPVGGISEKIRGAVLAGMRRAIIPQENLNEVDRDLLKMIQVQPVTTVAQAFALIWPKRSWLRIPEVVPP